MSTATPTSSSPADEAQPTTRERILDALVACIVRTGLRKVTMDDIATEAGLSRATIYSHFSNKVEIVSASVMRELNTFFAELEIVAARYDALDERLVETFAHAYRYLRSHPLVQRMIAAEPEILANYVARDTPAIPMAREWVTEKMSDGERAGLIAHEEREQAAELIVRAVHSLLIAPETSFDLDSEDGPQRFARRWLLPAVRRQD